MRTFILLRTEDVSGISGTGTVAEGVEFSDGSVAVRWLDSGVSEANKARGVSPTTVIHPSVASVEALHGHNGATKVVFTDPVVLSASGQLIGYRVSEEDVVIKAPKKGMQEFRSQTTDLSMAHEAELRVAQREEYERRDCHYKTDCHYSEFCSTHGSGWPCPYLDKH